VAAQLRYDTEVDAKVLDELDGAGGLACQDLNQVLIRQCTARGNRVGDELLWRIIDSLSQLRLGAGTIDAAKDHGT